MTAYERKIIHTELQASDAVTTYSIGEEPHRKLVIDLKNNLIFIKIRGQS